MESGGAGWLCNAALQHMAADPAWRELHRRVGGRLLERLLTRSSVFALAGPATFLQLSGCPISSVARRAAKAVRGFATSQARSTAAVAPSRTLCPALPVDCGGSTQSPSRRRVC